MEDSIGIVMRRSPIATGVVVLLLCALTIPLPFLVRTGVLGLSEGASGAVIPAGIFWTFLASTCTLGATSLAVLYGRRIPIGVPVLVALAPLCVAVIGAYLFGLSSVPFAEVRPENEAFRAAAVTGPYLLAAGAACSAVLCALLMALSDAQAAIVAVPAGTSTGFHFGASVASVVSAGIVVLFYRPGVLELQDLAFPDSLKVSICVVFVLLAPLSAFAGARLERYGFLSPDVEHQCRAETRLLPLGACGFAFLAVLDAVEESRWRSVGRWSLMSQHHIGNPFWLGDAAVLVALAAVSTATAFLLVRRTGPGRSTRSSAGWLSAVVVVGVLASSVALDFAFGSREQAGLDVPLRTPE